MTGNQSCHVLAYYTNDLALSASNVALGTVVDQAITPGTNGYFLNDRVKLLAHYAGNDAYTSVRINMPSLRDPFLPYLDPISLTTLPANIPPVGLYGDNGPTLRENEVVSVEASRGAVAASDAYALLWITTGRKPIPAGPRIKARWTSAVTIAEGTWSVGAITFADNLPTGNFAVIGLSAYGANLLAARLVFYGGGFRPGVLAQGAQGEWNPPAFPESYQGELGRFLNTVTPQIECFGVGAGAAQIGYMDLVQL